MGIRVPPLLEATPTATQSMFSSRDAKNVLPRVMPFSRLRIPCLTVFGGGWRAGASDAQEKLLKLSNAETGEFVAELRSVWASAELKG